LEIFRGFFRQFLTAFLLRKLLVAPFFWKLVASTALRHEVGDWQLRPEFGGARPAMAIQPACSSGGRAGTANGGGCASERREARGALLLLRQAAVATNRAAKAVAGGRLGLLLA